MLSDFVMVLNMLGITQYIVAVIIAFGSISLYFFFIKRS